jgi:hypothetical protein
MADNCAVSRLDRGINLTFYPIPHLLSYPEKTTCWRVSPGTVDPRKMNMVGSADRDIFLRAGVIN